MKGLLKFIMNGPVILIETSGRQGLVGLALDGKIVDTVELNTEKKHAQDLAGKINQLMSRHKIGPKELKGVIVARGPGSFTGLRIGLVTAITLAYATDAKIVGVSSFQGLAEQVNHDSGKVTILADGLRGGTYYQSFQKESDGWRPTCPLDVKSDIGITPNMVAMAKRWIGCPEQAVVVKPSLEGLLAVGLPRLTRGESDSIENLEPLYVQPSSAERQWQNLGRK